MTTSPKEAAAWLPRMDGKRVLVIGDLCLDEYIVGRAQRLSREAPVPILEFEGRFTVPGAAANPALNIKALEGIPLPVGVVGDDEGGETLLRHLSELGIDTSRIIVDPSRGTTVKTRVLAEVSLHFPQQIVRVDRQERSPLAKEIKKKVLASIASALGQVDAVLISDYKSGVVDQETARRAIAMATERGIIITVDSQGDLNKFKGATVVKCNRHEAEEALRRPLGEDDSFAKGGRRLLARLGAGAVLITRGNEGMSLVDGRGDPLHIPAANRSEVFDVTGAGDTVIATLTLALAAGAPLLHAALLANCAAGIVVRRLGNATPTQEEIILAVEHETEP